MRESEYIIWRAETREQIEKDHPDWTKDQVQEFLEKVEASLRKRGFFDIAEERGYRESNRQGNEKADKDCSKAFRSGRGTW